MTTSGHAEVNGGRLYYELVGDGEPIAFVHGLGVDRRMWGPQVEAFARTHRALIYDQRGYGHSDPATPGEPVSHALDLAALIEHLDLGPCHVVAQSMGGQNAVELALRRPDLVRSLTLVGSSIQGWSFSPEVVGVFGQLAEAVQRGGVPAAREVWLGCVFFARSLESENAAPLLRQMVSDYSGWHWTNNSPNVQLDPPMQQQLGRIGCPTLAIVGEHESSDAHAIAELIERDVPNARRVEMAGAGHFPNLELPDDFNALLAEQLAS